MKIGIDTFGCNHARSGFGAYILYFISNIPDNSDITFELFGAEIDRFTYASEKDIKFVSVPVHDNLRKERKWHKSKVNSFAKKNGYDIILYPAASKVLPRKFKNHLGVIIVNSLISIDIQRESHSYKRHLKQSFKNCHKIIAATEFIKNDLISLGARAEKITVIHNGIDHKLFFPVIDVDNPDIVNINPFSIKRPYFIYGSSLTTPDKKHIELIRAFELFKKQTSYPHRLVLAGTNGDYAETVHKYAFESEYSSDIVLTGFFAYDNIAKLYAGSEACVFPAVHEGAGLPLLEAMACGVPVLCSDRGALKEVGGNCALYFNSDNVEEIAEAMKNIIENKELKEKMVADGLVRAADFNWEYTVEKTLEVIEQTLPGKK